MTSEMPATIAAKLNFVVGEKFNLARPGRTDQIYIARPLSHLPLLVHELLVYSRTRVRED